MNLLLILLFLVININCYELLFEKVYEVSNCIGSETSWGQVGGSSISCSNKQCKKQDNTTIVRFVYDATYSSLRFIYAIKGNNHPHSYLAVDILFFQFGGTSISLKINDQSTLITSPALSKLEHSENMFCPDERRFYKATVKYYGQMPPGTLLQLFLEKEFPTQHIGIRNIRVYTQCVQNCQTCSDQNNCSVCMEGFARKQMPSGEYVCEQTTGCSIPNCYTCFKSNTYEICSICNLQYSINSSGTSCTLIPNNCPAYTYEDDNGICIQYTFSCIYQDKVSKLFIDCAQKEDARFYKCDTVVKIYDIENYSIFQCGCGVPNCKTCSDYKTCSDCKSAYIYNDITSKCDKKCQTGYYDRQSSTCKPCLSKCIECSTGTTCDTCESGYFYNNPNHTCDQIPTCNSNQYFDQVVYQCKNCLDSNCLTCTSSVNCTQCLTDYTYNSGDKRCNKNCSSNQYYIKASNSCGSCPEKCLTCTSSTDCATCKTDYTYDSIDNRCNKNCSSNQYYIKASNSCENCPESCLTCTSSTECVTCQTGYTIDSNDKSCKKNCSTDQYYIQESNSCEKCPQSCLTCTSSTVCVTCQAGYTFDSNDKSCNRNCSSNQYYIKASNSCENCSQSCLTCTSSTICVTCQADYTFDSTDKSCNKNCSSNQYYSKASNSCVDCPEKCFTCNSDTNCTQCYADYKYDFGDKRCNKNCSSNQYYIKASNDCGYCPEKCLACTSSTDCVTCQTDYTYDSNDNRCNKNCSSNQYYIKASNSCVDCPEKCLTCNSDTNCTQCQADYKYDFGDKRCNKNCSSNQYYIKASNDCGYCPEKCLACTSSTVCVTCQTDFTFDSGDNRCNKNCSSNQYYIKATNDCGNCPENCLTCNSTKCTRCNSGYTYSDDNQRCISCIQNCDECNITQCTKCSSGYTYSTEDKKCYKDCQKNQYLDNIQNQCINCSQNCQSCKQTQCTQCISNYYIDPSDKKNCIACKIDNCSKCSSQNPSECLSCNLGYILSDDKSICIQNVISTTMQLDIKKSDKGYKIYLKFSRDINFQGIDKLNLLDLSITNTEKYIYNLDNYEDNKIEITIISNQTIKQEKINIQLKNKKFIEQNYIKQINISGELEPPYVIIPQDQKAAAEQIAKVGKSVSTVVVATMLPIIILSNFYILINTIDITGFLYYMLFINIRHPENVVAFYSIFKDFQFPFIPNFFQDIVDKDYVQEAFPKFKEKETDLYFIKNAGQTITIYAVVVGIYLVAKILSKIKIKYVQTYFINAIENTWEYNGAFDLVWNTYIYPLVGVLLQFYSYDFGDSSYILNYSLHSIFIPYTFLFPFLVAAILFRQKNIQNDERFQIKFASLIGGLRIVENQVNQNISIKIQSDRNSYKVSSIDYLNSQKQIQSQRDLYKSSDGMSAFSLDNLLGGNNDLQMKSFSYKLSLYNKYYNVILYLRKLIFGIIIVCAHEYMYFQLSSIMLLNIFVFLFIVFAKPFQSNYENVKNAAGEVVLICILGCGYFLVNDEKTADEQYRLNIGWIIVAFSSFILLWHTFQLLFETLKSLFLLLRQIIYLIFRKKTKPFIFNNQQNYNGKQQQIDIDSDDNGDKYIQKQQQNQLALKDTAQISRRQQSISNEEDDLNMFQSNNYLPNSGLIKYIYKDSPTLTNTLKQNHKSSFQKVIQNNNQNGYFNQQQSFSFNPQSQQAQNIRKRKSRAQFIKELVVNSINSSLTATSRAFASNQSINDNISRQQTNRELTKQPSIVIQNYD